jgi:hypothetical protein
MGLFDDPDKLLNRNFGWGLASYTDTLLDGEEPSDSQKLALFVDEEGVLNTEGQILLWKDKDPIDALTPPTFSKKNQFVEGLKKVINPFPTYGVLLFPTILPSSREVISQGGFFGPVYSAGTATRFPRDTPEGFVPCAGQTLRYPGGVTIVVPNLASRTSMIGRPPVLTTENFAPPGMAYMMRVPDGYTEMVPDLNGRELGDFGTDSLSGFFGSLI